jgi:subtilisin-like proprotein convertase family protein
MRWLAALLCLIVWGLNAPPVQADTFTYTDVGPIAVDEVITELCMQPIIRTFAVSDSFLVEDLDVGFTIEHDYRSDLRLVLQSPAGTRVEVLVEFFALPDNYTNYVEDQNHNYDVLFDSDSTNPIDDGDLDDAIAPFFDRTVQPVNSLAIFNGENAQGNWLLEICDAGILDAGTYLRSELRFVGTPVPTGPTPNTIRGTLFRDYDSNGSRASSEPGVPGITVTAYNDGGNTISQATTDGRGSYTLTVANGTAVRVEISGLPSFLQPGVAGAGSATTVAFVTSPALGVDVGLHNPGQHCGAPADTRLALTCFRFGAHDGGFAEIDSVMSFAETAGSNRAITGTDQSAYTPVVTPNALHSLTGAVWGLAYSPLTDRLYTAAFVKRHASLGANGNPTTIYALSPTTTTGSAAWFTLDPARPDPHDNPASWIEDFAVFDKVGKEGWGDLEIADDYQTLYGVDLATRHLVAIPILANGAPGTPTTVNLLAALPAGLVGGGAEQCPSSEDLRPFGLGVHDGSLYIGMVCSAQSTVPADAWPIQAPTQTRIAGVRPGDTTKLRAYVFAWNGSSTAPLLSTVLNFPLTYDRGCLTFNHQANCETRYDARWAPWAGVFPVTGDGEPFDAMYPQPILSDIEFNDDDMVLFVMDRFGHQSGGFTQSPHGEMMEDVVQASDILYACRRGDGWVLEKMLSGDEHCSTAALGSVRGNTDDGSADRIDEYFAEDTFRARYSLHDDVGFGSGVVIPGRNQVIHTVFDPIYRSESKATIFNGGLHWYSADDGHWRKAVQIYDGTGDLEQDGVFSKAAGLGDITALCDAAPIEIGNRVWRDDNQNGVQDPSEPPIAGVTVELYQGPTKIGTAITDANGQYLFSSRAMTSTASQRHGLPIQVNTAYTVRIPNVAGANQQLALHTLQLTETNDELPTLGGSDQNDSDGQLIGNNADIPITTGGPGANNHTYDFGFYPVAPTANGEAHEPVTPRRTQLYLPMMSRE